MNSDMPLENFWEKLKYSIDRNGISTGYKKSAWNDKELYILAVYDGISNKVTIGDNEISIAFCVINEEMSDNTKTHISRINAKRESIKHIFSDSTLDFVWHGWNLERLANEEPQVIFRVQKTISIADIEHSVAWVTDILISYGGIITDFFDDGSSHKLKVVPVEKEKNMALLKPESKNTIFYGPPGTGKTYKAREILKAFTTKSASVTDEQWEESLVKDVIWREVVATALEDLGGEATVPLLRKHKLVAAKYRCMGGLQSSLSRLWATLQGHTPEDSSTVKYSYRRRPYIFDKNDDATSTWRLLPDWKEESQAALELLERFHAGKPAEEEFFRYESVTFHQSYSYEDFVEGIRPVLDDAEEGTSNTVTYEIRPGIFKRICGRAEKDPDNDYALFIDEINRGNISKILGELITLIEENKRWGAKEQMEVSLPYSGEKLRVPGNLYIIGTMNTADRSLALIDTALRRRFSFIPLYPDPSSLPVKKIDGVDIERLLDTINKRIAILYDKEHCIGHSYFWDVSDIEQLAHIFENKILPLLEEYFFEDYNKIRRVLGNALIIKSKNADAFLEKELDGQIPEQWEIDKKALKNPGSYIQIYESSSQQPSNISLQE